MACCCTPEPPKQNRSYPAKFKMALWIALVINLSLFIVEVIGGIYAHSSSLWADALDFAGDSMNYAISLAVLGMSLYWRATVALLKGVTMASFGIFVLIKMCYAYTLGIVPEAMTMGLIGILALIANVICAVILYAFRDGDANMKSVWLCSRNDAIGNIALIFAAIGVFGTNSIYPDLLVALIMAVLGISAGYTVIKHALLERKLDKAVENKCC
ncbi:cation diffusion facilitator family transporter [Acinetobacter puyangensis]|uniref:Cation efflux family protein n=1 Tax=Acinetobacter puyangensis TaxID=1096779 RepID=A0A240E3H0_9GAMM|nr:cation transporter [Acinetobacter puyangensis]SNX43086.1 Cation efflux family protein [Acinetobacter puyangensis]